MQNIMYSGHLAQMVQLYQWMTGNDTLVSTGWDDTVALHYNTSSLLAAIAGQMRDYGGAAAKGGVPCEPDSIFVVCNNFPHVAFALTDALAPALATSLQLPQLSDQWRTTVVTNGPAETALPINGTGFFNLVGAAT